MEQIKGILQFLGLIHTKNTEHQADECITVSELIKAREIYKSAIEKLVCQEN